MAIQYEKLYHDYLHSERQYSPLTIQAYLADIEEFRHFLEENGGFKGYPAVQALDVRVYLGQLYEEELARTTISRKVSSLRMFYQFLLNQKYVQDNPFSQIALRKHQNHLPEFFYEEEMDQLFQSAYQQDKHPLWQRDAALLEFLYATGARVTEIVELELSQLDFSQRLVLIHGKGNKDRFVPFGHYAQRALQDYIQNLRPKLLTAADPDEQRVFLNNRGKPLTSAGISYILNQLMKRTSLTGKIHPHMLRHTFATQLLNRGADMRTVQELLGHANLSTTQIYTHVSRATLQKNYQDFFPRAKSEKDNLS
ncbi:tyrosine recombinase XerC [Eupransor demetentiae]|uniref:Tyrosine recombinase XerC n=1 Tax=Eupransor demetentiae TaxID=3109584 RepID=A0ABP0ENF4_9LACO|nr:Site-specific recombinase XerD (XerD) [Lactobacillaceae bacterium LMG 33000]